jgi:hypothetical protein
MVLPSSRNEREFNKFVEDAAGNVCIRVVPTDASGADMLKTEDSVHATGDPGIQMLAVRNDTLAALAGTDGDYSPFQVDANGALYVSTTGSPSGTVTVTNATGSGALSTSTALSAAFRLTSVTVNFNAAPTTSENLTVTVNANDGAAYDTVLFSVDPSATSATDIVFIPDNDLVFESGDEIDVAFTNTDANTFGLRIVTVGV